MVSNSPSGSKPLCDSGHTRAGFQEEANKDPRNEEPLAESQWPTFTPSSGRLMGNSVMEALS